MDFITTPLTTAIVFYFIYRLFELFVRRSERMMYISKMRDNCPANLRLPDLWPRRMGSFSALRAGCLILGLGLGLLLAELLHLRDVRAGDKGLLARAADDQAADLVQIHHRDRRAPEN